MADDPLGTRWKDPRMPLARLRGYTDTSEYLGARAARIILDHLYGDPATIRVQIAVGVGTRHGYT